MCQRRRLLFTPSIYFVGIALDAAVASRYFERLLTVLTMEERNSSSHVVFGDVWGNAAKYEMDRLVWLHNSNFDARRITVKSTELKRLSVLQNPEYVPVRTDKCSILHIIYYCLQNFSTERKIRRDP